MTWNDSLPAGGYPTESSVTDTMHQEPSVPQDQTLDAWQWAETLLHSRRTTLPKRLTEPGPDPQQQQAILRAAAAAPDHDQLLPWRFIEIPAARRSALGEAFATALLERDPHATAEEAAQAQEKAYRSPWLILAVARLRDEHTGISTHDRLVSAGAAIQNMLLMATALGYGSSLTSGKAMESLALRDLFRLTPGEHALCFINIGTVATKRHPRPRPDVAAYWSRLA